MKVDNQYKVTDKEIVSLENNDLNEIHDQASTVELLRISHNDGLKSRKIRDIR